MLCILSATIPPSKTVLSGSHKPAGMHLCVAGELAEAGLKREALVISVTKSLGIPASR